MACQLQTFDEPDRRISDGAFTELSDPSIALFPSKDSPKFDEIMQGAIGNCPLMGILAGIVNAKPALLRDMVKEQQCKAKTRYGKKEFSWDVLVTIKFKDKTMFVSKLLWRDEGGDLLYSHSATSPQASWMSYVEKAYAQRPEIGGYGGLDGQRIAGSKPSVNSYYEKLLGSPEVLTIASAKDSEIWGFISDPKNYAIVAASKKTAVDPKYVDDHAYTIIAGDKLHDKITLYNPWGCETNGSCEKPAPVTSLAMFRKVYEFLFRAKV